MKKLLQYIMGYYRVVIKCRYPERIFNYCGQNGIELRNVRRIDGQTVSCTLSESDYKSLLRGAEGADFSVETAGRFGFPMLLVKMKKRTVLGIVTALSLCLLWASTLFIWDIRIEGNDAVSKAEILNALDKVGVRIGTNRLTLDPLEISNSVLLLLPKLGFITVNTTGSVAFVQVRERVEMPPMAGREETFNVIAGQSGVITKMTVMEGKNLKSRGEAVQKGETLVTFDEKSGEMHAKAQVYARTWYDMTAVADEGYLEKHYTGRTKKKVALLFGRNRLNLYFNSGISYASYDKISSVYKLGFGDFLYLPISVAEEVYTEYEPVPQRKDRAELRDETVSYLKKKLTENMESGMILSSEVSETEKDGALTVQFRAGCAEEIGKEVPVKR